MTSEPTDHNELTASQRESLESRQIDQDRTLEAMHQLETALSTAAAGREAPWRDDVLAALGVLDEATAEEDNNAGQADSLLSDVKRTQPRLRNRVRGLRAQYRQLRDAIAALRQELEQPSETVDFADIRHRLGSLLTALRYQRARESDLIYEAYYEAFKADLGG
jgi:hypothetical protein